MRIRIITSCTGEKRFSPDMQLTREDLSLLWNESAFKYREDNLAEFQTAAEDLYTGQQHVRLMRGVREIRERLGPDSVELWILSAGYGLIPGNKEIVPYECTFQGMKSKELRAWAEHLRVASKARQVFETPADFTLVLLGDAYLRAIKLDESIEFKSPTLFLTSDKSRAYVKGNHGGRAVVLANREAKRFSCGLVGLKGELAKRLLARIAEEGEVFISDLFDPAHDVLTLLDVSEEPKPAKTKKVAQSNPVVDRVIEIPQSWWQRPHRKKLRYFIPEWDDLVDPDYDFQTDTHSGGSGDWSNEVYAHQMYPEPNYDGILMSRAVAEKSKKKKARINAMGVHRFLRVPREFPIMGDCGAFDYIMEEKPPYTTEDVLDYYTRLDFDYGVSVDHLIVSATEHQKNFRYDLTIHNADDFLKQHRKADLNWEPIAAVQGWDAASYAKAAAQYVKMGYRYIALGGLVRSPSRSILEIIGAVREKVPPSVQIHLFGVARLDALRSFQEAGVQSVDSASYLRQAWMRINQSYASLNGPYAALRIPEAGKSFRAKHMEQHVGLTEERILKLEKDALRCVRQFAENR